ncbi:hypothetical protein ACFSTI_16820 [Rhizorhabdus histidinilytica]
MQTLADLDRLARFYQVVNIKLDKCGGLTEALRMAERARVLGLSVMVGNMIGSSLAMGPAYLVGQYCAVVDLDGPIFLQTDPSPSVRYRDGFVDCSEAVWGGAPPSSNRLRDHRHARSEVLAGPARPAAAAGRRGAVPTRGPMAGRRRGDRRRCQ